MKKPKHILVLSYWPLEDALIQAYTLPYLRIIRSILPEGSSIRLLTLEKSGEAKTEYLLEEGIFHFSFALYPFGRKAASSWIGNIFRLRKIIRQNKIETIHTWCTPAGAIGWILSVLTRRELVLDSYEPHAEAMVENGTWKKNGFAYRILFFLEKRQTFRAKWLIAAAPGMREYSRNKYGFKPNYIFVKPACTDLEKFNLSHRKNPELVHSLGLENKIVAVYAGKLGGIYLREEVFRFFAVAARSWGERFRVLMLGNTSGEEIEALAKAAGVNPAVILTRFVAHKEIPDWIGLGDFALTPVKPVPTKKCCSPVKDGEYWALGLPVLITKDISEDSEIIASSQAGVVLENLSDEEMQRAVEEMDALLQQNADGKLSTSIHELAVKHRNFKIAEDIYRKIYEA